MAEKPNIASAFDLTALELQEVIIHPPAAGWTEPETYQFEVTIDTNADERRNQLINIVRVNITDSTSAVRLGTVVCACMFSVADIRHVINMKNGMMDPDYAEALNSISISTTRGVMFGELKGTFLHRAVLPVIDVKGLQAVPAEQISITGVSAKRKKGSSKVN